MSETTVKGPCNPGKNNRCLMADSVDRGHAWSSVKDDIGHDDQPHPAGVNTQHFFIFFPEDLWGWRSIYLAFQTHSITL